MAKFRGKGFVLSALVAGAASFLSKKENRDMAMKMVQNLSSKFGTQQPAIHNSLKEIAETPADVTSQRIRENNFVGEGGAQTALAYYNENDQQQIH